MASKVCEYIANEMEEFLNVVADELDLELTQKQKDSFEAALKEKLVIAIEDNGLLDEALELASAKDEALWAALY